MAAFRYSFQLLMCWIVILMVLLCVCMALAWIFSALKTRLKTILGVPTAELQLNLTLRMLKCCSSRVTSARRPQVCGMHAYSQCHQQKLHPALRALMFSFSARLWLGTLDLPLGCNMVVQSTYGAAAAPSITRIPAEGDLCVYIWHCFRAYAKCSDVFFRRCFIRNIFFQRCFDHAT